MLLHTADDIPSNGCELLPVQPGEPAGEGPHPTARAVSGRLGGVQIAGGRLQALGQVSEGPDLGVRHTSSMQATTVLVEGESDRLAVETLARRLGRDLADLRVSVVPMGGATSIAHFLDRYGPSGAGHRLLGMCDAGESPGVARALGRAGIGPGPLAELGFHVCHADLEDELIRCLGIDAVLEVIAAQDELASFRLLQRQPSLRERPITAQLHRFFGGRSGNKVRYAPLLVDALPAGREPPPLARLVASF